MKENNPLENKTYGKILAVFPRMKIHANLFGRQVISNFFITLNHLQIYDKLF